MTRPDGRVEPGQKSARAFSARALNRAQDAADIVLGGRPNLAAEAGRPTQFQIVVPCLLNTVSGAGITSITAKIGHWVQYSMSAVRPTDVAATDALRPQPLYLTGNFVTARTFIQALPVTPVGVIVGGASLPQAGQTGFVDLCIFGPAVAFTVKRTSDGNGPYRLGWPTLRDNADTVSNLLGVLEKNPCGPHTCISSDGGANYGAGGVNIQYSTVIVNG